ncbi:response regulator, partial [Leptospira santarosai]|nr:response regulator [Leptospira santarosai]
MNQMIKVLIVDDQELIRMSLSIILGEADFEIVGVAEHGKMAVELTRQLSPDVVLMDIHMPMMDGVEATHK